MWPLRRAPSVRRLERDVHAQRHQQRRARTLGLVPELEQHVPHLTSGLSQSCVLPRVGRVYGCECSTGSPGLQGWAAGCMLDGERVWRACDHMRRRVKPGGPRPAVMYDVARYSRGTHGILTGYSRDTHGVPHAPRGCASGRQQHRVHGATPQGTLSEYSRGTHHAVLHEERNDAVLRRQREQNVEHILAHLRTRLTLTPNP